MTIFGATALLSAYCSYLHPETSKMQHITSIEEAEIIYKQHRTKFDALLDSKESMSDK